MLPRPPRPGHRPRHSPGPSRRPRQRHRPPRRQAGKHPLGPRRRRLATQDRRLRHRRHQGVQQRLHPHRRDSFDCGLRRPRAVARNPRRRTRRPHRFIRPRRPPLRDAHRPDRIPRPELRRLGLAASEHPAPSAQRPPSRASQLATPRRVSPAPPSQRPRRPPQRRCRTGRAAGCCDIRSTAYGAYPTVHEDHGTAGDTGGGKAARRVPVWVWAMSVALLLAAAFASGRIFRPQPPKPTQEATVRTEQEAQHQPAEPSRARSGIQVPSHPIRV